MFDDGGYMCKVDTISQFPIVNPTDIQKGKIKEYVDKMLKNYNEKDYNKLNEIVMDLYSLNEDEKNIIRSCS